MRKTLRVLLLAAAVAMPVYAAEAPRVTMQTNLGTIKLELNSEKAPNTVANFLEYVNAGFYDGTIFHRVIPGFMVQGGGYGPSYDEKSTRPAIQNEANNSLKNNRGTVAMARTGDPHSASAQFFINVVDNEFLNHTSQTPQGWGYAVFGRVVSGMDVVDKIVQTPTGAGGPFPQDVPKKAIVIEKVSVDGGAKSAPKIEETKHESKPDHNTRQHNH